MSLEATVNALKSLPLFQVFTDDQIRLIAFGAEALTLQSGDLLFAADEPAESAYLVVSGAIELASDRHGRHVSKAVVREGILIGGLSLVCATERPATARALMGTELIRVRRPLVRRVLEEYPDAAHRLHTAISKGLISFVGDLARSDAVIRPPEDA